MAATATEFRVTTPQTDYGVKPVSPLTPFRWLRSGFEDFRRLPGLSLLYGSTFALLCAAASALIAASPWYTVSYLTTMLALGPFLASGLYVASRARSVNETPTITATIKAVWQRKLSIGIFSLILALVMAAGIRLSALVLALKLNLFSLSPAAFLQAFSNPDGWVALAFFVGIGVLVAAVVFTISAVAIPLIVDRDTDLVTSILTSWRAVIRNRAAMLAWAVIIVALTAVSSATAFVGFVVVFPVLAYATWHSYRALLG